MICSISIYMGYFVKFSEGGEVSYSTISWLACTFFANRLNISKHIGAWDAGKVAKKILLYLFCLAFSTLLFFIYRYDKPVVEGSDYTNFMLNTVGYAHLTNSSIKFGWIYASLMLCYVLRVAYKKLCLHDILYIGERFIKYTTIMILVGYLEFFTENLFDSLFVTNSAVTFFGKSGAQQIMITYDRGWSNIQVFTKEASMFSTSLLYSVIIAVNMVILQGKKKKYLYYIGASMLLMVINRSMSSYVYVFLLVVYITYLRPFSTIKHGTNPKIAFWLLFVIVLVLSSQTLLMSDSYLSNRLNESITQLSGFRDESFTNTSEGLRYFGMYHCLSIFADRPLFGVGLGCIACVSGVITLLSNIGLLGLCSYVALVSPSIRGISRLDSILLMLLVVIAPNLLLNDLNTMFALIIPFAALLTAFSIKYKNNLIYDYE